MIKFFKWVLLIIIMYLYVHLGSGVVGMALVFMHYVFHKLGLLTAPGMVLYHYGIGFIVVLLFFSRVYRWLKSKMKLGD